MSDPPRRRQIGGTVASVLLLLICGIAAVLRFSYLSWGAPYFHFHIDEHFVFSGADMLRRSLREASLSAKFFMYGPLPMWLLNGVMAVRDRFFDPLVLTLKRDEVAYMVAGRAVSAALSTACVPLTYVIARRVGGRTAGLIAALLLAFAVIHLREAHFFTVDTAMTFFSMVAWFFAMRIAESGRWRDYVLAGLGLGAAVGSKYSATFLVVVLAVAHLCAPGRPRRFTDVRGWVTWIARGFTPLAVAAVVFVAIDPMAVLYFSKFRGDILEWIVGPQSGSVKPIYITQFADVRPALYWFSNLLWWGLGPAFEIWGLLGVVWLLVRRDRQSLVAASFPIAYYVAAAQGIAPVIRYVVPLAGALAVTAGVLSADLLGRPRLRSAAMAATVLVCGTTALYAMAYMNVYRSPDSRLTASAWLLANVRPETKILLEPSHNIPPMGSYLTSVDFNKNYVLFYPETERRDYYHLYALDTYRSLYNRGPSDEWRRDYIKSRLALADWIVMDDTFVQFYEHLPESDYGVMKQYYRDLFAGRLGFHLVRTFKVYPSLFGRAINDDDAELTFRLFDHPTVFIFARNGLAAQVQ